jgi:glycosyltransferase involved in cell wall biosynthesis
MLRELWNQTDAPGIIVLNLMDKILENDETNEYVLFFRGKKFFDRYDSYPNVTSVRISAPNKFLWDQLAVPLAARKYDVDLIFHAKHSLPLLTGRKTVMHLRGAEYWIYPEHFGLLDLIYAKLFLVMFCRKATHLITESRTVTRDFRKFLGIPEDKISMIYLAPADRFSPLKDRDRLNEARRKYHLPDRFLFTVTRVLQNKKYYEGKNILNAIEAFRRSAARKSIKFVIAGRETKTFVHQQFSPDDDILDDLVVLDAVSQSDLPQLYNLAEFFLFPSKYESFGIPILEAMACGCPVITSTAYSCPEIAGGAAILVDRQDVDAMANAIDALERDPDQRRTLRALGLERLQDFGWPRAAVETLDGASDC